MRIFLDFETRSLADLKKVGAWQYSKHPSTEILVMAWQIDDGPVETFIPGRWGSDQVWRHGFNDPDISVVSRNTLFEYSIMVNICIPKMGFLALFAEPRRWICTMGLAYLAGLPGQLEKCAQMLHLKNQKDEKGAALIQKYCKPVKKNGSVFREPDLIDIQALEQYCIQDVKTDKESFDILSTLPNVALERPIWELDFELNIRGIPVDIELVQRIFSRIQQETGKAEVRMNEIGVNVRSSQQLQKFFAKHGYSIPNCQADTLEKIPASNPEIKEVLSLRHFLSKASLKKYRAILDRVDTIDNYLRHFLTYYGAHTGRYSSKGVQLHNLPKSYVDEKTVEESIQFLDTPDIPLTKFIELAKILLPACIKAEPGKIFLKGDFSSVEARGLAYLAGDEKLLDRFRRDEPIYEILAARIFGRPPAEIIKGSFEREVGKKGVLGGGYGIGVGTFLVMCQKEGVDISEELAYQTLQGYRAEFPKIPIFWRKIEAAFILAWKGRAVRTCIKVGEHLSVTGENAYVKIQLPSGRFLYYHKVKIQDGRISYQSRETGARVHLWGGVLAENVTQAYCRDLLVACLIRCSQYQLTPVLHVHDEIVLYEDEKEFEQKQLVFEKLMNTPPEWAPTFPLKTEVEKCYRYFK